MSLRPFYSSALLAAALCAAVLKPSDARGQGANGLLLTGGRVRMTIGQVDALGNLLPATSSHARLLWGKQRTDAKITVSAVRFGPEIRLTVEGINPQNSSPVGPVELESGMPQMDFVVGIPSGLHGSVRLLYTADASGWSGDLAASGETQYLVTYTLTAD